MDHPSALLIHKQDDFCILEINRPHALNALNKDVFDELDLFFDGSSLLERGIRGVILTGAGRKAFAAGADIKEFSTLSAEESSALSRRGQEIMRRIETADALVIAAVHGFALGGGCELAMACHMILASEEARFGQPEVKLGLVPGYGATQRLAQRIGRGRAIQYLSTADMISAEQAERWGLCNAIFPAETLLDEALNILRRAARQGPRAVAGCIALVDEYYDPECDGYDAESTRFGQQMLTSEGQEGIAAFIEKRKPVFTL